jgi:YesN/AraC family two-component response regulator
MDKKLRLMVVDDNPHARKALAALFSTQDWVGVISEASDGEDAIRKIKQQSPDLILMDVEMPVMNGLEATKVIKSKWSQIKIIVLTMYPDYQEKALNAGADAFLIKGCPLEEVTTLVHNFQAQKMGNSLPIFTLRFVSIPPQI